MGRMFWAACLAVAAGAAWAQEAPGTAEVIEAYQALVGGVEVQAAVEVLREAAEAGDPRAQVFYGSVFEYGDLGSFDAAEAIRWYEAAAAQGYAPALFRLGAIHRWPRDGREPDPVAARAQFQRGADLGQVASMAQLGDMLLYGVGGPQDERLGRLYLDLAVENGDPDAAIVLGFANEHGDGGPQDLEEARRLYTIAAVQGAAVGENNLGYLLSEGIGGPADPQLGAAYLRAAMEDGYARAGSNMAELIAAQPDIDPRPLAAAAHCLWATHHADWQDGDAAGWPCMADMVAALSEDERKQADKLARTLVAP